MGRSESLESIADDYSVSVGTIKEVRNQSKWSWLTEKLQNENHWKYKRIISAGLGESGNMNRGMVYQNHDFIHKEFVDKATQNINNNDSKLSPLKVIGIWESLREGKSFSVISEEYKVGRKNIKEVRGMEFEYTAERAYCNKCGEEIFIPELHDKNLQKIDNAYREKAGIIKVSEIKNIVEQYNTGKRPLSLLLGWGETTLTRYLDGDIPSKNYSNTLKKVKDDYQYMKHLAQKNKEKVTDKAFNDLINAINNLQQNEIKTEKKIDSVIKYLLKELGEVTPLALQKLLYYGQGFYKTFYNEFLSKKSQENSI